MADGSRYITPAKPAFVLDVAPTFPAAFLADAAALDAQLQPLIDAQTRAYLARPVKIKAQLEQARRDYRAERRAADAEGDRELARGLLIQIARAENNADPDEMTGVSVPWGMG